MRHSRRMICEEKNDLSLFEVKCCNGNDETECIYVRVYASDEREAKMKANEVTNGNFERYTSVEKIRESYKPRSRMMKEDASAEQENIDLVNEKFVNLSNWVLSIIRSAAPKGWRISPSDDYEGPDVYWNGADYEIAFSANEITPTDEFGLGFSKFMGITCGYEFTDNLVCLSVLGASEMKLLDKETKSYTSSNGNKIYDVCFRLDEIENEQGKIFGLSNRSRKFVNTIHDFVEDFFSKFSNFSESRRPRGRMLKEDTDPLFTFLSRTSDGNKKVLAVNYNELKKINWETSDFMTDTILVSHFNDLGNKILFVQVKENGGVRVLVHNKLTEETFIVTKIVVRTYGVDEDEREITAEEFMDWIDLSRY